MFIRRGQLTLISAAPGGGKSAVIQNWLQRGGVDGRKSSTLYFSADSDASTMYRRAASIATGEDQSTLDQVMRGPHAATLDQQVDAATKHMRFVYTSSPTSDEVFDEVDNYAETYGDYPEVVVMDNLLNLQASDSDDEFRALHDGAMFLHDLAKDTNAAVVTLHHVTGFYEGGNQPIPLGGLRGKVSKIPELIITMHQADPWTNLSVVKNRSGQARADGQLFYPLRADLARMSFEES